MTMKVLIDMQGTQSENRFRGIGRYTHELVNALILQAGPDTEIHLLVNARLTESAQELHNVFSQILPKAHIHSWLAPIPFSAENPKNSARRALALKIQQQKIQQIQPDIFLIPSLFDGFMDNAVVDILPDFLQIPTVVISYDLIPMLYPQDYLNKAPGYKAYYETKLQKLPLANYWLAISESSKQELVTHLHLPQERITNIKAGVSEQFKPSNTHTAEHKAVLAKFAIHQPYFIYSGGADSRKNLPRLLQAFSDLPLAQRQAHQLVLVGKISPMVQAEFIKLLSQGSSAQQVVFTGFIDDTELILLYQAALCFVFPSWHEGFGLPAIEAMACGIPTIVGNRTSLPEIVDNPQALFDPFDVASIAQKMQQIIEDKTLREHLKEHGLQQAQTFTWQQTAQLTLTALQQTHKKTRQQALHTTQITTPQTSPRKPTLAMVTPLPPLQTGIADYMFDLIPALDSHFELHLVTPQPQYILPEGLTSTHVHDVAWFTQSAFNMEYIVYQMGNSPFHTHMLALMSRYPGLLVLHDFFLSGLMSYLEWTKTQPAAWNQALLASHGYAVLIEKLKASAAQDKHALQQLIKRYPANKQVFKSATQVIVHSHYSKQLAVSCYGASIKDNILIMPLTRDTHQKTTRQEARKQLKIAPETLLVCSFGILAATKLNHRLLQVWQNLVPDASIQLVFVGKVVDVDYDKQLQTLKAQCQNNVQITGWVDSDLYHQYLAAADIAVQLRTDSRGETSAAVLDAMNYGLATLVNANGSMAELPTDSLVLLDDEFSDTQLTNALQTLINQPNVRKELGASARRFIEQNHAPAVCVKTFIECLNPTSLKPEAHIQKLLHTINYTDLSKTDLVQTSHSLDITFPSTPNQPTLYLDITNTFKQDLKTGIERYAKAMLKSLIESSQTDWYIQPVVLKPKQNGWGYYSAGQQTLALFDLSCELTPSWQAPKKGDVVITLDLAIQEVMGAYHSGYFAQLQANGTRCFATVFDLLPILQPQYFPPQTQAYFKEWLQAISQFHGILSISNATQDDLKAYFLTNYTAKDSLGSDQQTRSYNTLTMGADIAQSLQAITSQEQQSLEALNAQPLLLMVGTIEPRKGHLQTLQAVQSLWQQGTNFQLVIVGKEGWVGLPDDQRRNMSQITQALTQMAGEYPNLHWFNQASDGLLKALYQRADVLLVASEGEGFGLPIIEAAHEGLPVILRELAVFREIAGEEGFYFKNTLKPSDLAHAIQTWLTLYQSGQHPRLSSRKANRWQTAAQKVVDVISQGR